MVHVLWTQANLKRGETKSRLRLVFSLLPRVLLMSGPGLMLGRVHIWVHRPDAATTYVDISMASDSPKSKRMGIYRIIPAHLLDATLGRVSPSLTEAIRREGPTPHLGSTIVLILFTGAWLSWS